MATENYKEILKEVYEKLNNIDSVSQTDILNIRNSVESIENLITDTQAKLNFQDIKEKLDNISFQVDNCNDSMLKDLLSDINALKNSTGNVSKYLENIQNTQNLTLTSAEFEEFQKQQLDLALKTNENIYNELSEIKKNISVSSGGVNVQNLDEQISNIHENLTKYIEKLVQKIPDIPSLDEIGAIMSDLNSIHQKNIKQTNQLVKDLKSRFSDFQDKFESDEFESQISKISEIYDSLNIIKVWTEKVGYVNQAIENVYARLGENIDFDEVSDKIDIIYENITALNNWSLKIDSVQESVSEVKSQISSLSDFQDASKDISNSINQIKEHLESLPLENLNFEDVSDKIDLIYENINLLNEWVIKIDDIVQRSKDLDENFNKTGDIVSAKLKEINDNIDINFDEVKDTLNLKLDEISMQVPDIKSSLEKLASELHSISTSTNEDGESYMYTLIDIESDFSKLQKSLDDNQKSTSDDIKYLKESFNTLNEDITSISLRTNKLILSADDANREFKTYLDSFKTAIHNFELQNQDLNSDSKLNLLCSKITEMIKLLNNTVNANNNLNTAFTYLAEWIDATGNVLTGIQQDLAELKSDKNIVIPAIETEKIKPGTVENYSASASDNSLLNENISELKSLLTGIIVQLNTALTPDIDSLNERIDKLAEENNNKLTELETFIQEKVNLQEKQIASLEEKINNMIEKFDRLVEVMADETHNYEVKDILNFIASQINANGVNIQSSTNTINEVAQKLETFDNSINKIVSYIEED